MASSSSTVTDAGFAVAIDVSRGMNECGEGKSDLSVVEHGPDRMID